MSTIITRTDYSDAIDITAVTKLKHADLWTAAKKCGGQSALARHLGVTPGEVGDWINLKKCPPTEPVGKRWTEEYIMQLEAKLSVLTGKAWDELFPRALHDNVTFLHSSKTIERTERVQAEALESYATRTRDRLRGASVYSVSQREAVMRALKCLSHREREVIKLRYGFDTEALETRNVGRILNITQERVRQIEGKAIRKLQMFQHQLEEA